MNLPAGLVDCGRCAPAVSLGRQVVAWKWQVQSRPHVNQRFGEVSDQVFVVKRCWRDAKTLGPLATVGKLIGWI